MHATAGLTDALVPCVCIHMQTDMRLAEQEGILFHKKSWLHRSAYGNRESIAM